MKDVKIKKRTFTVWQEHILPDCPLLKLKVSLQVKEE
jgi:hypothetical protein